MAKITQTVFVHYDPSQSCEYMGWARYDLKRYQSDGDTGHLFICEAEVTFEVPDNFDPRPQQVKALEEKKRQLQAQFAAAVSEIHRQISQLQAIEHTEAA
jgi:hypothetical protein